MYNFNINTAGFAIVGLFILTWVGAMLVWRYGRIEEKWIGQARRPARDRRRTRLTGSRPACGRVG